MDINLLVNLTSCAWSLGILAALANGTAGRQAPLLAATGASRSAFAHSLTQLFDLGLLERNPGHGHPLRPEFRLTATGAAVAPIAARLHAATPSADAAALLRRTWTLPILAVTAQPRHFTQIRADLTPVTDRALSQALRQLEERSWLHRHVDPTLRPPRPTYEAIALGATLGHTVTLAV